MPSDLLDRVPALVCLNHWSFWNVWDRVKTAFLVLLCFGLALNVHAGIDAPGGISFNRDIRPILSDNCLQCHGQDAQKRKADLRLDTREGLLSERENRPVITPGDLDRSELIHRITTTDPDDMMPPAETKKRLSSAQIDLLKRWVREGAVWQDHWAFVTPNRPGFPETKDQSWARNPIDHFILAKIEAAGLAPNPEADRRTLIRRLSFDLTGLPPSPEEVEEFAEDERANAVEHLVDRLLASERFGERMALAWMDAARYGDSSVHHADGPRFMWLWRDWVINAYNQNKPFDQFTVEQLAGDLLPDATLQQKVASGFNRNHGTTDEGGAIAEEYRVEYVVDRVKTTSTVWLGLTMECGQCHSHKYDPISQKEYYQFYAYFNNTRDGGMQTRNGNAEPFVKVPNPAQQTELDQLDSDIARFKDDQEKKKPAADELAGWIARQRDNPEPEQPELSPWRKLGPFKAANAGQAFNKDFGPEKNFDIEKSYKKLKWTEEKFEDGEVVSLGSTANAAIYLTRTISVSQPAAYEVSLGSDDSIKVWLNGKEILANNAGRAAAPDQEKATLNLVAGDNRFLMKIGNGGGPTGFYFKLIGSGIPKEIRELFAVEESDLTDEQRTRLSDYYGKTLWPEGLQRVADLKRAEERRKALLNEIPTTMIMAEMEKRRETFILNRGHYDSPIKDNVILPGVPAALPALPKDAPPNRLGLARWLVDPDHPLTARVTVNRYWQLLFGNGLVSTSEDFGTRGEWPTHPELLDWLARDFVDHGWDIKRTLKQMVMSATYGQASMVSPGKLARDPTNRLLARAPRLRLQGELIRDNALALSGLLNGRIGGASVKPYQPPGIWNEVSLDGGLRYQPDTGDKLYRRSMYIYWKRSAPSPSMRAFDAPTREKCVVKRQRTNTPLQALVTLNDVQFVEAARKYAERILRHGGGDFSSRLNYAFLLATSRQADDVRQRSLKKLYDSQLQAFLEDGKRADELLAFGESKRDPELDRAELAAWTTVASVILNLDEVLTKE